LFSGLSGYIPGHLQIPSIIEGPQYSHLQSGPRRLSTSNANHTPQYSSKSTPGELNPEEAQLVQDVIASRRSSYALPPSSSEQEVVDSHFHDMDLCILLHQMDDINTHEVVRKALRKAIRQRVKKLGLKYDSAVSALNLYFLFESLTLAACNSQSNNTGTHFIITTPEYISSLTISSIMYADGLAPATCIDNLDLSRRSQTGLKH
jgi:hypothetical protein